MSVQKYDPVYTSLGLGMNPSPVGGWVLANDYEELELRYVSLINSVGYIVGRAKEQRVEE